LRVDGMSLHPPGAKASNCGIHSILGDPASATPGQGNKESRSETPQDAAGWTRLTFPTKEKRSGCPAVYVDASSHTSSWKSPPSYLGIDIDGNGREAPPRKVVARKFRLNGTCRGGSSSEARTPTPPPG
jgi:hypothetical protein